MKTISPPDMQKLLAALPDLPLLDVRTPVEFAEAHIPGARNVPLDELNPAELETSGQARKNGPLCLTCRSGQRSAKAADRLESAGFLDLILLEGGTLAWTAANLPLTRGQTKVISLERQVRIVAGSLVFIGVLLGWKIHPGFFGLSAFVGAGLVFAGITDFCGMGLLLAKMPWNKRVTP